MDAARAGRFDIRDRIAAHLEAAPFESVLSAELRALGTCGAFDRLFDLLSQFVSRVATYRWLAVAVSGAYKLERPSEYQGIRSAEATVDGDVATVEYERVDGSIWKVTYSVTRRGMTHSHRSARQALRRLLCGFRRGF